MNLEQEKEDEGRTAEAATMEKIKWLGDRMVPGLKITTDLPEYHDTGKCPMLDFQLRISFLRLFGIYDDHARVKQLCKRKQERWKKHSD